MGRRLVHSIYSIPMSWALSKRATFHHPIDRPMTTRYRIQCGMRMERQTRKTRSKYRGRGGGRRMSAVSVFATAAVPESGPRRYVVHHASHDPPGTGRDSTCLMRWSTKESFLLLGEA